MAAPSSPPVWPNGFTVNFTDVAAGLSGDSTTTGVMYYDASNSRSRVDRADGKEFIVNVWGRSGEKGWNSEIEGFVFIDVILLI